MLLGLLIPAFISGVLMFLAPCTLPIVPGYLGFISGVKAEELKTPELARLARKKIIRSAFFFVLGFSTIFILFGILVGLAGALFAPYREILAQVGGVLIIFFGLMMLGLFRIPILSQDRKIRIPKWLEMGKSGSSFLVGGIFAVGWSPCIGPVLGAILVLAGTTGAVLEGALLLAVFSLGLAVPFMLVAHTYTKASQYISQFSKWLNIISVVGGVFLVGIGMLLVLDKFYLFQEWGFELLKFINYEAIEQFL